MNKIPRSYYLNPDVLFLAKDLLGKVLVTNFNGELSSGIIIETEAYAGIQDKASHAYGGKITSRNKTMYENGGIAYVYLCYGIHHLFNVVTNVNGIPHAILIRAIEPLQGIDLILKRRKQNTLTKTTSAGPGTLSQALGISTRHNGMDLCGDAIWIEEQNIAASAHRKIIVGPRIGIDYAEEDALLPYRFILNK